MTAGGELLDDERRITEPNGVTPQAGHRDRPLAYLGEQRIALVFEQGEVQTLSKLSPDLAVRFPLKIHFSEDVVRNPRFGEHHTHVAHALSHRGTGQASRRLDVDAGVPAINQHAEIQADGAVVWAGSLDRLTAESLHPRVQFQTQRQVAFEASFAGNEKSTVFGGGEENGSGVCAPLSNLALALEDAGRVGTALKRRFELSQQTRRRAGTFGWR